jgi:WD40 repeat protein
MVAEATFSAASEGERGGGEGALRLGPCTVLRATTLDSVTLKLDIDGTGKWLLLGAGDGNVDLVPLGEPGSIRRLGTEVGLCGVALSPDGRWAVSVGGPDDAVCVWDVARATLVRRLPHGGEYGAGTFSPDGRWLVTGFRSDFCFWEVGSWERKAHLPRDARGLFSPVAFARDGRLLALVKGRNRIHLYDSATLPLRHLATLETPEGLANLTGLGLSPDGTRLAATTDYSVIALWDLRRLRQELAALDLDWEMPPYPAAEPAAEPVQALTVKIQGAGKGN